MWKCNFCEFEGTNENVRYYSYKWVEKQIKVCDNCFIYVSNTVLNDYFKTNEELTKTVEN